MEARELKDMTAVLRSINDGNPSNAERWVNLTQRVIRAEYRANTAERAAARKDWEKQNAEDDARMARCRAEEALGRHAGRFGCGLGAGVAGQLARFG